MRVRRESDGAGRGVAAKKKKNHITSMCPPSVPRRTQANQGEGKRKVKAYALNSLS